MKIFVYFIGHTIFRIFSGFRNAPLYNAINYLMYLATGMRQNKIKAKNKEHIRIYSLLMKNLN